MERPFVSNRSTAEARAISTYAAVRGARSSRRTQAVAVIAFFVGLSFVASCASIPSRAQAPSHLVGTWRIVKFCDVDSVAGDTYPLGEHPRGIFVYSPNGQLSLQAMLSPGESAGKNAAPVGSLANYFGYFGTYTITSDTTVIHHVVGGTIPRYIGTDQPRQFRIWGANADSLTIGGPAVFHCRLLTRIR